MARESKGNIALHLCGLHTADTDDPCIARMPPKLFRRLISNGELLDGWFEEGAFGSDQEGIVLHYFLWFLPDRKIVCHCIDGEWIPVMDIQSDCRRLIDDARRLLG